MPVSSLQIEHFFHEPTSTFTYLVTDRSTGHAAVIDPVLDYDQAAGRTGTHSADKLIALIRERGLILDWILETHAHADHLTAAAHVRDALGGRIGIGAGITEVQSTFASIFDVERDFRADGSQFGHLFADGESFEIGSIEGRVIATPGHTNDSVTYLIEDAAFIGDTLFMPDSGTARCDFPGGDSAKLYRSIKKLYALPDDTRLFTCHDYPPDARPPACCATVAEHKASNIHLRADTGEDQFVALRTARDKTLDVPQLIIPSVQVNIRAGTMPPADDRGRRFLKVPLNKF